MASTRHSTSLTPIKIFNDSFGTDHESHLHPSSPMDNIPLLQPDSSVSNASNASNASNILTARSDLNTRLLPPSHAGRSPAKTGRQTSSPPLKHVLTGTPNVAFPTPNSARATDSLLKKPSPANSSSTSSSARVGATAQSAAPNTGAMFFSLPTSSSTASIGSGDVDKENAFPAYSSDTFAELAGSDSMSRGTKRPLTDSSPHDNRANKAAKLSTPPVRIPEPHEMPAVLDDGKKPRHTYAQLVAMAILRSPKRKLTLSSIYEWISSTFVFYRDPVTAGGWQNSIRHNLSLNKAFIKVERPRDDPGKGNYWTIEPSEIATFLDEKMSRRPASSSNRPSSRPSSSHGAPLPGPALAPMQPPPPAQLAHPNRQPMQPPPTRRLSTAAGPPSHFSRNLHAVEPSSDATIPLSDPALLEEDGEEALVDIPRPFSRARQSSPHAAMHSSPPIPQSGPRRRANTGTALASEHISSNHGSKSRNRASLNDSGYFSSLESSAKRRPQSRAGLDSLQLAQKRGRAEEEIARLRSSSQDISPSKGVPYLGVPRNSTPGLLSSSPTRPTAEQPLEQPLTPSLLHFGPKSAKSRRLSKLAVPTLSPDTQLANHRNQVKQLIGTPLKGVSNAADALFADFLTPQSQAFVLDDTLDMHSLSPNIGAKIDFFIDDQSPLKHRATVAGRSPEKPLSAIRPSLLRTSTTPARPLGDITNSAGNRPSPAGLRPPVRFASRLGSPLRMMSPEKLGNASTTVAAAATGDENFLMSSPFKKIWDEFKSDVKFASPFVKDTSLLLDDSASKPFDFGLSNDAFPLDPLNLFCDDDDQKSNSPLAESGMSIGGSGNGVTAGFLDLAGGFDKIGTEASLDKENKSPSKKSKVATTANSGIASKARPSLGSRSNTSFM